MIEELEELLNRDPFVPFRIVLTSGGMYDVVSPLQIIVGRSRLTYYYPRSDREALLRANQIAAFETLQEQV